MGAQTQTGDDREHAVKVFPLGDLGLLFSWPERGKTGTADIAAIAARIRSLALPEVRELVPAYRTLAVHLDAAKLLQEDGRRHMANRFRLVEKRLAAEIEAEGGTVMAQVSRLVKLPVVFGGDEGPDLAACAERSGRSEQQFVREFCSIHYDVAMMGFAPGFPYLSGLPDSMAQPRHSSPRLKVPAGSVGIAGEQAGVYPVHSPGGWQLIGRTSTQLFRPEAEEPFLLAPGDRVVFEPVASVQEPGKQQERRVRMNAPHNMTDDSLDSGFEVQKPGLLTTVQDGGRHGWQAFGVSVGGAMDTISLRTANRLVGNEEEAAVLEMTMIGASFRLQREVLAAFCGADMDVRADGEPLPMDRPVWVRGGSTLTFGRARRGCRTYMAAAGGLETPVVLGSRSTDARAQIGGIGGRALAAGDRLALGLPSPEAERLIDKLRREAGRQGRCWASVPWSAESFATAADFAVMTLRIIVGSEWEQFDPEARQLLQNEMYRVETSSDRMGLRLSGPVLRRLRGTEMLSHGVAAGTVQVPPNGQPIVLGAGCQPTGGYPKIAHIIGADLPLLAQCRPGHELRFRLVGMEEAWEIREKLDQQFRLLQAGIRLAFNEE